jgi:tetratricopeptide (TPR) repeat protein
VEAAIEVDPTHTVLLTSRAQLNSRLGNWDEALSGFEEALVTDPGNEAIRINLALLLAQTGDTDRALAVIRDALELAPQSHFVRGVYATILYYSRQYDLAIEQIEAAADMLAQLPPMAHLVLGLACLQKGSYQRALDAFAQASQPSGNYTGETDLSRVAAYARAITQARMGNSESARDALRRLGSEPSEIAQEPCWRGLLCFALGETAGGFDWLETAHRNGDMWVRYLKVQPLFDPLRSDPRFATLLERIALQRGAHPPANA